MAARNVQKLKEFVIEDAIGKWWKKSNSISILITGKSGTGKSSLVNAIVGQDVAVVGEDLDPETSEVTTYVAVIEGVKVVVWDSPGLQDGLNKEDLYLNDIETRCKDKFDIFLYCIAMDSNRFMKGSRDLDSIIKLTNKLGKNIWNNAVFVLTRANLCYSLLKSALPEDEKEKAQELYADRLSEWKSLLKKHLREELELPEEVVKNLPIMPAGWQKLPYIYKGDDTRWLSNLWMESLLTIKHTAQPALIKMNLNRLRWASDNHSESEFAELIAKEALIFEKRACAIGKALGIEETGRAIGELEGVKACTAHVLEHIIRRTRLVQILHITIDPDDAAIIAKRAVLALPL